MVFPGLCSTGQCIKGKVKGGAQEPESDSEYMREYPCAKYRDWSTANKSTLQQSQNPVEIILGSAALASLPVWV